METVSSRSSQFSASRDVDLEIKLNTYVHDSANLELRDDLPTVLDGTLPDLGEPPVVKPKLSLLVKAPEPVEDVSIVIVRFFWFFLCCMAKRLSEPSICSV